jgi:hypothetical protein
METCKYSPWKISELFLLLHCPDWSYMFMLSSVVQFCSFSECHLFWTELLPLHLSLACIMHTSSTLMRPLRGCQLWSAEPTRTQEVSHLKSILQISLKEVLLASHGLKRSILFSQNSLLSGFHIFTTGWLRSPDLFNDGRPIIPSGGGPDRRTWPNHLRTKFKSACRMIEGTTKFIQSTLSDSVFGWYLLFEELLIGQNSVFEL